MAVRSTLLIIADDSGTGTRPQSELTAIDPTYDDVQADADIWNIQTQAWEPMQGGVNTHTVVPGSDRWGLETRAREGLRSRVATGKLYWIKYGRSDSTLNLLDRSRNADGTTPGPGVLHPCWSPSARDTAAYTGMIAEVTASAAAADLAGDTLSIDGIQISIYLDDIKYGSGWRGIADRMRQLIETLRVELEAIAHVSLGSIRGDAGPTPVTVLLPHAAFTGHTAAQKGVAMSVRTLLAGLQDEAQRINVFPTWNMESIDGEHFNAQSLVDISFNSQDYYWPVTNINDSAFTTEANMALLLGDSIFSGSTAAGASDNLLSPITGVKIFDPYTGSNQTLEIGVNNLAAGNGAFVGPELPFAELLRAQYGAAWIVKGALWGAYAGTNRTSAATAQSPLEDVWQKDWDPATRGGMYDLVVRGWLAESVRQLRLDNKKPIMRHVVVGLGTNDITGPISPLEPFEPGQVVAQLKRLAAHLRRDIRELRIDEGKTLTITFVIPSDSLTAGDSLVPTSISDNLELVQSELLAWAQEDGSIKLQSGTYSTHDGLHWDVQGCVDFARDLWQTLISETDSTAQPLFTPSKTSFLKALRLSGVTERNDGRSVIDAAITAASTTLYHLLGTTNVDAILAKNYNPTPRTAEEHTRMLAVTTEQKAVRVELLRTMPTMLMDGSGSAQVWQDEAAFRDGGYLQIRDEIRRLETEISNNVTYLVSGIQASAASLIAPDADSVTPPGSTIMHTRDADGEVI